MASKPDPFTVETLSPDAIALRPKAQLCGSCGRKRKPAGRCRPEVRDGHSYPLCAPCLEELTSA